MARFFRHMISENVQVFWAALQRGEFITDAAEAVGTDCKQGARWVIASGGVRPRRGRNLQGRYFVFAEREEIAIPTNEATNPEDRIATSARVSMTCARRLISQTRSTVCLRGSGRLARATASTTTWRSSGPKFEPPPAAEEKTLPPHVPNRVKRLRSRRWRSGTGARGQKSVGFGFEERRRWPAEPCMKFLSDRGRSRPGRKSRPAAGPKARVHSCRRRIQAPKTSRVPRPLQVKSQCGGRGYSPGCRAAPKLRARHRRPPRRGCGIGRSGRDGCSRRWRLHRLWLDADDIADEKITLLESLLVFADHAADVQGPLDELCSLVGGHSKIARSCTRRTCRRAHR